MTSTTVPTSMRASVLVGARRIEVQERPVPSPAPDEVLVRIGAVGVCGSDVHFYEDGRLGDWELDGPLVLGHESGGEIAAVGRDVDASRVGERVSIEPQHPSTTSAETLRGEYNLDPHMRFYAIPGTDGAFQEYATIQSHFAHRVPDEVGDDAAGLMEPLSVAIATARKAGFTAGSRVFIAGAGPIGIVTAQVARAYGAFEVIVSDVSAGRRERALEFGATSVIDPLSEAVEDLDLGADSFVDASGAPAAVVGGFHTVRPGGAAVLVGMGASEVPLPIPLVQGREITVTGIFRYNNTWPTAIGLVASGAVDLDSMVTGRFALDKVEDAFASTRDEATLKSVVDPRL